MILDPFRAPLDLRPFEPDRRVWTLRRTDDISGIKDELCDVCWFGPDEPDDHEWRDPFSARAGLDVRLDSMTLEAYLREHVRSVPAGSREREFARSEFLKAWRAAFNVQAEATP